MRHIGRQKCLAALAFVIIGTWLAVALAPTKALAEPDAVAQTCDPAYGCPPSSSPPGINPTCTISPSSAAAGDVVTATLRDVPSGSEAKLLFDGEVVAQGVATGTGSSGSLSLSFTIQAGTAPGLHSVVFVGAGFECDTTNGAGYRIVQVLGESTTRTPPGSSSGGSLARTGITVALLLAIAIVLVVAGTAVVRAAKRHRRRAQRQRAAASFMNRVGR